MELVITLGEAPALFYLFSPTQRLQKTELKKQNKKNLKSWIQYTQPMRTAVTVLVIQLFLS